MAGLPWVGSRHALARSSPGNSSTSRWYEDSLRCATPCFQSRQSYPCLCLPRASRMPSMGMAPWDYLAFFTSPGRLRTRRPESSHSRRCHYPPGDGTPQEFPARPESPCPPGTWAARPRERPTSPSRYSAGPAPGQNRKPQLPASLRQGQGNGYVAAAQGVRPSGQVVNMAQPRIAPGIGAVENHNCVSVIQHDVPALGRGLDVAGG